MLIKITMLLATVMLLISCDIIASSKIEKAVVAALKGDSRIAEFSFEVSHEGEGKVLITGEVDNPGQIEAVREVAAGVTGVTEVTARINIADNSSSGLMQDGALNSPFF